MSLAVTGTVGIDTIETSTGRVEGVMGGSAAYTAAAASFFGPVRLVAAVGDDYPAEFHARLTSIANVDTQGLDVRAGRKTFRWGGRYAANMNNRTTLFTELGVLIEEPPRVPEAFADSRAVFLANMHPGVQRTLLERFPKRSLVVADTMDLWIGSARDELQVLCRSLDGLVLNYDEAEMWTGHANAIAAAKRLLDMGPRFVIVKKGEHGAVLVHRDGIGALPAYPSETVIDPTGAGDSFAGGIMGSLSRLPHSADLGSFDNVKNAITFGTVIASFTIEAFSLDRLLTLTSAEVMARHKQFTSMLRF